MVFYPNKKARSDRRYNWPKLSQPAHTESTYQKNEQRGVSCGQSLAAISIRRSAEMVMFRSGALFKSSRQYDAGREFQRSHPLTLFAGTFRSLASCLRPQVVMISRLSSISISMENFTIYVKVNFASAFYG